MKISLDTSAIVEIERGRADLQKFLQHDVFISSVVAAEIFTGTYLRRDWKKATSKAKRLFSLFEVVPLDLKIAEVAGKINAKLILKGLQIDFQDVLIASTFIVKKGDLLITNNINHFRRIEEISDKIISVREFIEKY
jgi:predicted nucleic acid-binding protein